MIDCAVALILKGNQVLIARRKQDDTFGGYWEFPGGKKRPHESLEECLIREVKEEVDLDIRIEKKFHVIPKPYPQHPICLHFYLCRAQAGEARAKECDICEWVDIVNLRDRRFPPANDEIIKLLLKNSAIHPLT